MTENCRRTADSARRRGTQRTRTNRIQSVFANLIPGFHCVSLQHMLLLQLVKGICSAMEIIALPENEAQLTDTAHGG
jgi:hypothetical protein